MKKILIVSNSTFIEYRFRKRTIKKLLKYYKVYLLAPFEEYESDLRKLGCELIELKINGRGTNLIEELSTFKQINSVVRIIKPDVLITFTIKPNIYSGLILSKKKVKHVANLTGLGSALENRGIKNKIIKNLYIKALEKSDYLIFQNLENKYKAENMGILQKQKYLLTPGSGVDLDKFIYVDYPQNDRLELLFIGRVMKDKGIDELIVLDKFIKDKGLNASISIIGKLIESEYETRLKETNIKYLGFKKDTISYMKESDIIIHPSYHEGMSNALLEGAAIGRPLLASNIAGCREIIEDGKTGFLFELGDKKSLINAFFKIYNLSYEDRKKMGKEGRIKVQREFDREIVSDIYMDLINELLGEDNDNL